MATPVPSAQSGPTTQLQVMILMEQHLKLLAHSAVRSAVALESMAKSEETMAKFHQATVRGGSQ